MVLEAETAALETGIVSPRQADDWGRAEMSESFRERGEAFYRRADD